MSDDLRQRYAEAIRGCGPLTVTKVLYAVMAIRDEELDHQRKVDARQREEILRYRMNAEKDVCVGCIEREHQRDTWAEASRQNGVKYEAAKQRWYESKDQAEDAEARLARVRALHPSREEADAAKQVLCVECAQPAPCRTRQAVDDPGEA